MEVSPMEYAETFTLVNRVKHVATAVIPSLRVREKKKGLWGEFGGNDTHIIRGTVSELPTEVPTEDVVDG